jgi:phosphoenolpyruvate synthase/pyruvate phosphate dikinase
LGDLADGEGKADETKQMIDRVRTFIGYREYPKYGMVSRYFVYKQALLEEAGRLVQAGVLREKEDIFYLTLQELHDIVSTNQADDQLVSQRRDTLKSYEALTPPRVSTSDGEVVAGTYRRDDAPTGALVGSPVSAGIIEGRPASSWTWRRPTSSRATSWSRPTRTPAGRLCSSRSRDW